MQRRFRLLAALLVIAVMQNGVLAAPLMPGALQSSTGHAHHHSGQSPMHGNGDCCDTGVCKCGCASTSPAAVDRPDSVIRDWSRIAATRSEDDLAMPTGATGAPYRPPA